MANIDTNNQEGKGHDAMPTPDQLYQEQLRKADEILSNRLEGIENELRQMRAMVERLVRVEERLTSHLDQDRRNADSIADLFKRINALEMNSTRSTTSIATLERFLWIGVAALAAWFGGKH